MHTALRSGAVLSYPIFMIPIRLLAITFLLALTGLAAPAFSAEKSGTVEIRDALSVDRVAGPFTVENLVVRHLAGPDGLLLWELMRAFESLTIPQLRSLSHDLLRPRRFYNGLLPLDLLVVSAWADRDLAGATEDMLHIPDWEDSIEAIGDYDCDVEFFGAMLWMRLAERDFAKAAAIAEKVTGEETRRQFSDFLWTVLPQPADLPAYLAFASHLDGLTPEKAATDAVFNLYILKGDAAAQAGLETMPEGTAKQSAAESLADLKKSRDSEGIKSPVPRKLTFASPRLTELAALEETGFSEDKLEIFHLPVATLREVRRLSPEKALEFAREVKKSGAATHCLGWLLAMRAADGDPRVLAEFDFRPDFQQNFSGRLSDLRFALLAGEPGMEAELRAMPAGEDRNLALQNFLSRADLTKTAQWVKLAQDLKAPAASWSPLLVRLASLGQPEQALALADAVPPDPLPDNGKSAVPGGTIFRSSIVNAWGLRDFPAASKYVLALASGEKQKAAAGGLVSALQVLRPADFLPSLTVPLLQTLFDCDVFLDEYQFLLWLAIESPEAGTAWVDSLRPGKLKKEFQENFKDCLKQLSKVGPKTKK